MFTASMFTTIMNVCPAAWDLGNFLKNSTTTLQTWGGYLIMLIGVIMIIASVYQIAKGLISHGKTQVNWAVAVLLLILGGAFLFGGFEFVRNIASGGKQTIEDLGNGATSTIVPYVRSFLPF